MRDPADPNSQRTFEARPTKSRSPRRERSANQIRHFLNSESVSRHAARPCGISVCTAGLNSGISEKDVISYDFSTHTMKLRPEALARIPTPVHGLPFVVSWPMANVFTWERSGRKSHPCPRLCQPLSSTNTSSIRPRRRAFKLSTAPILRILLAKTRPARRSPHQKCPGRLAQIAVRQFPHANPKQKDNLQDPK